MKLCAIVAVTDNNVISSEGAIPWKMPADFKHLKDVTWSHPIIMGRKTHEYIGRTLPGRTNIVLSRNKDFKVAGGSLLVHSIDEALSLNEVKKAEEAFAFGGEIYNQTMPQIEKIYLTRVHTTVEGDNFFQYKPSEWNETSREEHKKDADNPYDYDFITLERKTNTMIISVMVAASDNDVISKDGVIPWKMPADEKHMDAIISGHVLIMGRGTYNFMGKAYPGCTNVVVSRQIKDLPDAIVVHSMQDALDLQEVKKDTEPFIFGGESIFNEAMPYTQKIFLTRIHASIDGDRFFHYNPDEWTEISREEHKKDEQNPYDYDFIILERVHKLRT